MIERIAVRNFILVDELELEFSRGFNVLSGETGAGKSILVGALSVLFGARGGADLVRTGAEEALVAGEFFVQGHDDCVQWLAERDIAPDEGIVLVRRTLRTTGRGTIYMQNTPVTRADLEEFSGFLLDLHSQHEHQSLFHETTHRRLLDRSAGIHDRVAAFGESFSRLNELQEQLREIKERERDRARETEMLQFAIQEIGDARVRPGEREELEAERTRMSQYERLAAHVDGASRLFEESDEHPTLSALLKQARHEIDAAARIDSGLDAEARRLESLYYELEDLGQTILGYRDTLVYDPARLDAIEERLSVLRDLQRKYGGTEDAILQYADQARESLDALQNAEESRDNLVRKIQALEQEVGREARAIHAERTSAAQSLQQQIVTVLRELAMGQAEFVVLVESRIGDTGRLVCGPHGADRVRFLISTNTGEPPRPLSMVASGGEISRVMLAIKTVLAGSDDLRCLVFDEIDTGIGGKVALALASHLRLLANHTQVICITHLATIAVRADNHIAVEKHADSNRTVITVKSLAGNDRTREIARMLSGEGEEAYSLGHAKALLERHQREAHGKDQ
jgi:DNA repair protein RecN (Recombination protein N)